MISTVQLVELNHFFFADSVEFSFSLSKDQVATILLFSFRKYFMIH